MPLRERVGDELAELRLAAEKRFDREHLRPAPVVSAVVPTDATVLGLAHAGGVAGVDDVLHAVESDIRRHGRLVEFRLVRHWTRRRLPRLADPDFRRLDGVGERLVRLDPFGDRTARPARKLVLPVRPGHAGVVCVVPGKEHIVDRDVLVGVRHVHVERGEARIDAVLDVRDERELVLHPRDNGHERGTRRLHAVDGHREPVLVLGEMSLVETERAERPGWIDVVARLALPRNGEGGLHVHAHGVGGNAGTRPDEMRRAVFDFHGHRLDLTRLVRPQGLHLDVHTLAERNKRSKGANQTQCLFHGATSPRTGRRRFPHGWPCPSS